ncbi:MAG: cyclic nucleotide-binding domain-containing protein [Chloroflexi bacterium]|nr:cyclic nucleotide-binding domain-containing protein [Chloroflexota bacterium]
MSRTTHDLSSLPVFSGLDERSLQAIAILARELAAPAGTVLIREGDPATSFYVIVGGTVRVERDGRLIRSMSEGGFIGEIGLVEGRSRTATVTCATDCVFLEFGAFELGRVLDTFPTIRARVDAALTRRPHRDDA